MLVSNTSSYIFHSARIEKLPRWTGCSTLPLVIAHQLMS